MSDNKLQRKPGRVPLLLFTLASFLCPAANIYTLREIFICLHFAKLFGAISLYGWAAGAFVLGIFAVVGHYYLVTREVERRYQECQSHIERVEQNISQLRSSLGAIEKELDELGQKVNETDNVQTLGWCSSRLFWQGNFLSTYHDMKAYIDKTNLHFDEPSQEQGWLTDSEKMRAIGGGLVGALFAGGACFTAYNFAGILVPAAVMASIPIVGWGVLAIGALVVTTVVAVQSYRMATREFAQVNEYRATLSETLQPQHEAITNISDDVKRLRAVKQEIHARCNSKITDLLDKKRRELVTATRSLPAINVRPLPSASGLFPHSESMSVVAHPLSGQGSPSLSLFSHQ